MKSRNLKKRKSVATAGEEQNREVVTMSRELSLYEAMGGTYTEVDGILYPNIDMDDTDTRSNMVSIVSAADIGKYGRQWISYMKKTTLTDIVTILECISFILRQRK